jgi:hypothetical protein
VKGSKLVMDEVSFLTDINPTDLPSGPISNLTLGMRGTTSTTAAVQGTTGLASISLLRILLNGIKTEMSGTDLLAFNCLVLNKVPKNVASGATKENTWSIMGLILPINIPAGAKAQVNFVWVTQTNVSTPYIALYAESLANLPGPLTGIQRRPLTPTTTASFGNTVRLSQAGAKIVGLLCYSTTIPTTTALTTSLHKLRLYVSGSLIYEVNWFNMPPGEQLVTGETTIDALIDNYRYIPFEEPLDASDVLADVYADDTSAVVLIPIYQYS